MAQMTGLNYKIQEMAHRIRELREIENFTIAEMANKTGVTEQEYIDCEMGRSDLNFAFLYRCALAFGVDVGDIIEGSSPNLNSFTVTRRGEGQRIEEAHDMIYYNMAASFRNRIAEPLYVPAEAEIRGDRLILKAGGVSQPVHARYAWTDYSDRVNLFGKNGLPVEPFSL